MVTFGAVWDASWGDAGRLRDLYDLKQIVECFTLGTVWDASWGGLGRFGMLPGVRQSGWAWLRDINDVKVVAVSFIVKMA